MNLTEIRAQLYDRLGYGTAPPTDVVRRLDAYVNEAHRELISMRGLAKLRRTILSFSSVASSPYAVLPQSAVRIAGIQDRTTQKSLKEISIQDLRFVDPGLTRLTSNPDAYSIVNYSAALAVQPSAAMTPYVISTAAGDTGIAYIEGITTGGYHRTASVVMTGVVQAAFAGTDWIEITKFYLSTAAAGVVTLLQGTGGSELGRIPIGKQATRYTRIQFHGTPSAVVLYYADVELHIEQMTNGGDESYLPEDFHWLLACGARKKEYLKREKVAEYAVEQTTWKAGVSDLKAWITSRTDDGRQFTGRFSQLGPYYPAGS